MAEAINARKAADCLEGATRAGDPTAVSAFVRLAQQVPEKIPNVRERITATMAQRDLVSERTRFVDGLAFDVKLAMSSRDWREMGWQAAAAPKDLLPNVMTSLHWSN